MSNNINIPPWKISAKGSCWCWHDEITDPELLSIIKPQKGKYEHEGYEYSVIVNDDGRMPVFKKQTKSSSDSQYVRSFKRIPTEKDLCKQDRRSRRIVEVRLVPQDEIHDILMDEDWEISEYNPVSETNDELVAVLVKRQGANPKATEANH